MRRRRWEGKIRRAGRKRRRLASKTLSSWLGTPRRSLYVNSRRQSDMKRMLHPAVDKSSDKLSTRTNPMALPSPRLVPPLGTCTWSTSPALIAGVL